MHSFYHDNTAIQGYECDSLSANITRMAKDTSHTTAVEGALVMWKLLYGVCCSHVYSY